jgi:hypothetical protein
MQIRMTRAQADRIAALAVEDGWVWPSTLARTVIARWLEDFESMTPKQQRAELAHLHELEDAR